FTISDFVADLRAPTPSAAAELVVPSQTELNEKFNNVYSRLYSQASRIIERGRLQLKSLSQRPAFVNPTIQINEDRMYLDRLYQDLTVTAERILEQKKQKLGVNASKLDGLSPLGALSRGFSVAKTEDGKVIRSAKQMKEGDKLSVQVEDGKIFATVDKIEE
ncbi:MAG: exodeoxyribonuclease VII large subunit, partial [Clostridia bacterium]|nr:exodeoxyribonuclease VII large subunit [Clostridia bacterium]